MRQVKSLLHYHFFHQLGTEPEAPKSESNVYTLELAS
jgi:hypothetical protein